MHVVLTADLSKKLKKMARFTKPHPEEGGWQKERVS